MSITQIKAEQIGVCVFVERLPIAALAARLDFGWVAPAAVSPVPDGANGNAADLCVFPVQDAETGQQ